MLALKFKHRDLNRGAVPSIQGESFPNGFILKSGFTKLNDGTPPEFMIHGIAFYY
jgi:hypothetical protein